MNKFRFYFDKGKSKNLWIPTNSNLRPSKSYETDSWFTIETKDSKEVNNDLIGRPMIVGNENIIRSTKIKIFPTNEQKRYLLEWMDVYRYVYNATVKYLEDKK